MILLDTSNFCIGGGYKEISFKSLYYSIKTKKCGYGLIARKGSSINKPSWVTLGNCVCLDSYTSLFLNKISDKEPEIIIGDNVLIGNYSIIGCSNKVVIEDNVLFGPHVHITDRNHTFEDITLPIRKQPAYSPGPVVIGKGSWLGHSVQVMPNVKIGKHCVIAAGSIVTKDIPDFTVAAGIPAKIIKQYNFETSQWEKL